MSGTNGILLKVGACLQFQIFLSYEDSDLFINVWPKAHKMSEFCWYNTQIFCGGFEKTPDFSSLGTDGALN